VISYVIVDDGEAVARLGKLEKLYERAKRNPGSVRWAELDSLLQAWGFACRQPGGGSSHYTYTRGTVRLTVPRRGSGVSPEYVRAAIKALGTIELEEGNNAG
jgi:hypothetical protein